MARWDYALALLVAGVLGLPVVMAQAPPTYNEIEAKPRINVQDKDDMWVLGFRFRSPRLITADVPGRGRRLCWYLIYDVANLDPKEPHSFIPDFELVAHDKSRVFHDQVLPSVQRAIQRIEDPTGHLDIKNSVTVASKPLPPKPVDAVPAWVTGVAIWDDVDTDTNQFSIFVSGLSNGWSVDDKEIIRRKTLQLNFRRLGDRTNQDARDIKFVQPEEWVYRASSVKLAEAPKAPPAKGDTGQAPAGKPQPPK
jgi:hypothetical protein